MASARWASPASTLVLGALLAALVRRADNPKLSHVDNNISGATLGADKAPVQRARRSQSRRKFCKGEPQVFDEPGHESKVKRVDCVAGEVVVFFSAG
jgi:hypothetical protein